MMSLLFDNLELKNFHLPEPMVGVCRQLTGDDIAALQQAGVVHVVLLDAQQQAMASIHATLITALQAQQISVTQLEIGALSDINQLKVMQYDRVLRQFYGKNVLLVTDDLNMAGALVALRAGWLRGRKMDTCLERGRAYGLDELATEVTKKLLVPW